MRTGILAALAAAIGLISCGDRSDSATSTHPEADVSSSSGHPASLVLELVSGSENEAVLSRLDANGKVVKDGKYPASSDLIAAWERANDTRIQVTYKGSIDIMHSIEAGPACEYDAVWPASSMVIALGNETTHVVKDAKSIFQSPVVLAVERETATQLGWLAAGKAKTISATDFLEAAEARRLKFGMTSATRSNSGASAFIAFLYAFSGQPDVLTQQHLENAETASKVKRVFKAQSRSAGSSGWLKTAYLEGVAKGEPPFNAMINYESLIIEANQELARTGKQPLQIFYLSDALCVADSPLGYVDKGDARKKAAFASLQQYLLTDDVQAKLVRQGRRPGKFGATLAGADPAVWNADWGIDIAAVLSPITMPEAPVIRSALELYMTVLRKPSYTVYVLDYSGSMRKDLDGEGERQLKEGMKLVLQTDLARQNMLTLGPNDVTVVIPFDETPRVTADQIEAWTVRGNSPANLAKLLLQVTDAEPGGGTNMYAPTLLALETIDKLGERVRDFNVMVVVMSDGISNSGSVQELKEQVERKGVDNDVPVYTVLFGKAEDGQMKQLAAAFSGRMFDGRKSLAQTFQEVQGYNR
ncbi:MAG: substrate-binding domain-containing protein [Planctomycetota bacterium]|nr:substrate-binding domain-containing protein [Planctomycetota bacterium]